MAMVDEDPHERHLFGDSGDLIPSPSDEMHMSPELGDEPVIRPSELLQAISLTKRLHVTWVPMTVTLTTLEIWSDRIILKHSLPRNSPPFFGRGPDDDWGVTDDRGNGYRCVGGSASGVGELAGHWVFRPAVHHETRKLMFELTTAHQDESLSFEIEIPA
jgi:hypothetical protein